MATSKVKTRKTQKLTDAERHARFIETARKVGASEDPGDFDKAFKAVASQKTTSRTRK
jgi:hypothetical protein